MAKTWLTDGAAALEEKAYRVIKIEAQEQPQKARLRVAAYTRVSSDSEDQLNSFAAQNRYYNELIAEKPEWSLVDIYADEGITGTSAEKRDDFQRMMAACRRGLIDQILVKSISRFARNTKECLESVRELKELGVNVRFERESINTANVSSELITAIYAAFAQKESESISGNMRWSYQRRMESGTYVPPVLPYGYCRVDGKMVPDPEQAPIVKRIFDEYLKGISVERIAKDLCNDQIPCRSGRVVWDSTAIRYIISNEKYMGDSLWQKYYTTDTLPTRTMLNRGEREAYYAEGTHEGIVSAEVFNKANALMKKRAEKIKLTENTPFALRKKMYCEDCGSLFRRKVLRGVTAYWVCIGHDKKRKPECCMGPIPENEVYTAFCRMFYKLKHQSGPIFGQMLASLQVIRNRRMLWSPDIVSLNKKISELSSQNQTLAFLKQQGLVDPDIFISQTNELTKQLRQAKLEKEKLMDAESDMTAQQTQEILDLLENGPNYLDTFDAELFGELVDKIIVESNDSIRFRLKNGLELRERIERTVR